MINVITSHRFGNSWRPLWTRCWASRINSST